MKLRSATCVLGWVAMCGVLQAQDSGKAAAYKGVDPKIQKMVDSISAERIAATMQKLESFGSRNTQYVSTSDEKGPLAARRWILEQFKSYSPRFDAKFDTYHVKKFGERFLRDGDVVNVVAVLPGKRDPERQFIVSGHYDSLHLDRKAEKLPDAGPNDLPPGDYEKSAAETIAPGVSDDGSGVAAVLELARVMSQYEFDCTLVFVAFDAEEFGLVGSGLYAEKARREHQQIEGELNNDIIGTDTTGDGRSNSRHVRLFSEDPSDSPSRGLARYIKETAERYVPSMTVDLVFRHDRFARGGDHTRFNQEGFAAVRFTSAAENFANQHSATDTFANASPDYTALVARVNGAALANLALAPKAPDVTRISTTGIDRGEHVANLARGKSGYAASLRWKSEKPEDDLAGYAVVMRSTLAPLWEREIFVGNVQEYLMEGVSIDDIVIGVAAVDKEGHESVVAPYVATPIPKEAVELQ